MVNKGGEVQPAVQLVTYNRMSDGTLGIQGGQGCCTTSLECSGSSGSLQVSASKPDITNAFSREQRVSHALQVTMCGIHDYMWQFLHCLSLTSDLLKDFCSQSLQPLLTAQQLASAVAGVMLGGMPALKQPVLIPFSIARRLGGQQGRVLTLLTANITDI